MSTFFYFPLFIFPVFFLPFCLSFSSFLLFYKNGAVLWALKHGFQVQIIFERGFFYRNHA